MQFSASIDYPADVETVAAMLASTDFATAKARGAGAEEHSVEIDRDGAAFTVITEMAMPTTMVPASFRSFVGPTVHVRVVEAWAAPAADGSRTSDLQLHVRGLPVNVRGQQHLAPAGTESVETYRGEVNASIPFVGKRVEQAAVDAVQSIVDVERRLGHDHLAR